MGTKSERKNYSNIEEDNMPSYEDANNEMYEEVMQLQIARQVSDRSNKQSDKVQFAGWDRKTCWDCGAILPDMRVRLGRVRCFDCQTDAERRGEG